MEELIRPEHDGGLATLAAIAGFYRIAADPAKLARELCIQGREATGEDILRAAKSLGLRSRVLPKVDRRRLARIPAPAIVRTREGRFAIYGGPQKGGLYRLVDPVTRVDQALDLAELFDRLEPMAILISRKPGGTGADPRTVGFRWFVPSLARYRKPFAQVLLASLFIQIFALAAPLFFQITVDKVLAHKGYETLTVLVVGLVLLGMFDAVLQYLRTYTLSHTTNRMDVELGMRLFRHLLRLPISYFETRAAGQIVARVRELETIRAFVTGQALFSVLDLVFAAVMLAVLFAYSWQLALVVTATIPLYVAIALAFRPPLRDMINEKFDRGAESQQFLVESVIGIQTLKAASVEPIVSAQWEDKLAGYVRQAFKTTMLGASGQGIIQFVGKMSNAVLLLFGAKAVMDGALTIGELIAFNMLAGQIAQPVLRLSQLWQDFQQARVSIERLGDILNANPEPAIASGLSLPQCRGAIAFQNVTFRYPSAGAPALNDVSFTLEAGETIGIVGASGSGKSTLAKLVQRFYIPEQGRILLDGADLAQLDPSWLRSNIGVVLQDSTLFNRTVYENIALANPVMPRSQVVAAARLAGADEFIAKLPKGYDTIIEERGGNLSGGQRQRIALARALAPNPRILILDEATSALDYESERLIQLNMRQIAANRTVIIIAHRLAAVRDCHRIIGMQNGRIVEVGPHDDLVGRAKGLYASLWNLQSERLAA